MGWIYTGEAALFVPPALRRSISGPGGPPLPLLAARTAYFPKAGAVYNIGRAAPAIRGVGLTFQVKFSGFGAGHPIM